MNEVLALAPLDERPVNTRYPQMLAKIAGASVLLPPADALGSGRTPADFAKVARWLNGDEIVYRTQGVVVSADFLLYGNLINARISDEPLLECLPRLSSLTTIGNSGRPIYAFSLITRVSNADNCVEEPLYWEHYGTRCYALSQRLDRALANASEPNDAVEIIGLEAEVPAHHRTDWLRRRLRNHTANLALLDMLAQDRISLLLLTSDDTSAWGLPSREKAWIEGWASLLSESVRPQLLIHPGADEVGSALITRMLCALRNTNPRIFPIYAVAGDETIVAPYEDRAVRLTVEGQIHACGAVLAESAGDADIILGIATPSPRRTEFRAEFADDERAARLPHYETFLKTLAMHQKAGIPVAIGDVAYPNGSDPLLIELLLAPDGLLKVADLAAYGAWNTAGNTLGTTVAQAVASLFISDDAERQQAQNRFLTHRFLEDWGYQANARGVLRGKMRELYNKADPDPNSDAQISEVCHEIEESLSETLTTLQQSGIGVGLRVRPDSVRLPWRRLFEVDFDLDDAPSRT